MSDNLNLLVISSDKYEAYWPLFYGLMEVYNSIEGWENIFHLSETKYFEHDRIISITPNTPVFPNYWSENLLFALERIDSDYIVVMLEDFFLKGPIDFSCLKKHLNFIQTHNEIGCLRLCEAPPGDQNSTYAGYMEHTSNQQFKVSTQAGIWKKDYLQSLIQIGEHPWDFEIQGSMRAAKHSDIVLVVKEDKPHCISYFNAVIQGKLTQRAAKHLQEKDLKVDRTTIPIANGIVEFYWNTKYIWIRKIIDFVNHRLVKIK
jgi:hypothetical protein